MDVVIVESPAKAKTINKYLGPGFEVLASYGHVRDLPPKNGSVDPDADFRMLWEVDAKAQKRLSDIAKAVKGADRLILATDPDREGEAISWHVLEFLREKNVLKDTKVQRVVFNAITKQSVTDAMKQPRDIDTNLVDAYLARRALDYLVGFTLSPVLWRKLPGARSAGRVQSVALRLVCDRELEIEKFVSQEYWSLTALLATKSGDTFEARLVGADGKKLDRLSIGSGKQAEDFKRALDFAKFTVASVESKPGKRHPWPPFTTSTLQQEASRKLGFSATNTMRTAQRLYEGIDIGGDTVGLITYMRTDGVQIAPEGIAQVRGFIGREYDKRYLPAVPRTYKSKAKNAQEAHEAIRPTDVSRRPADVKRYLDPDQVALYELIWKRTVASQMESAEVERTTAEIVAQAAGRGLELRATGTVTTFDGFLTLYQESDDDTHDDDENRRLPNLAAHDELQRREIKATQHFTEPPPRYTEASLVKKMEELGIGRPSTYAATLGVLRDRGYVVLDKKRLVPSDNGRLLTAFLESFFGRYVEYDFTADLEEKLDLISNDEVNWKDVLRDFWRDFDAAIAGTKDLRTSEVLDALNEILGPHVFPARADGGDPRQCQACGTGQLSLKTGKFGAFIGCSNYPECRYTRQISANGDESGGVGGDGVKVLGPDPETGLEVSVRDGRFGPYIQLGEQVEKEKPKRASIPKGWPVSEIDLEKALQLLSLPREIGLHPETSKPIVAGIGRFGPYVNHDGTYASLESVDEVFEVGLNRAVAAIAEKKARGPGRGRGAPGKVLGDHPEGGQVILRSGRFGPYVSHGKINATIPRSREPETITLDEAVSLIAAKTASGGKKAKAASKPKTKKTAAKKPAAKKTVAKKSAKTPLN